ncbi:MerR family transcriptional regulator [Metabacillus bambusae]|uniref:MerR family transcriptional regulator n=1 Tax=Metabacillus bambusae TaxID=2795218 RepID=A0ABS3N6H2_9BACI|nr:MerR family transcriptional regulator [Metabacillus bambusae]MBO1513892.1 MerR family transcriptional regulator [Metabacillus bambusae]
MSKQEGKYNIKAVTTLLGIQAGTLRAWERRYKMIAPKRNESGHRLYTEEHINTLKWLIDKVNKGFTISQAVNLLANSQAPIHHNNEIGNGVKEVDLSVELMDELLQSLLNFDENQANERLNKAFSLYTVDKVVIDMLGELLVKIDDQMEDGNITTPQKHFAFSFLRSRIGMILHTLPGIGLLPKVIAVCGPDESYELELLTFTVFLRIMGFEVIYIGASIVDDDFEIVLEKVKPKFLFLSCDSDNNVKKTLDLVETLSSKYKQLQIGLHGKAFSKTMNAQYDKYLLGQCKQQWEKWLKEKLGH